LDALDWCTDEKLPLNMIKPFTITLGQHFFGPDVVLALISLGWQW
jgi:hypothetical protein